MSTTVGEAIRFSGVAYLINSLTSAVIKRGSWYQKPELRNHRRSSKCEPSIRLSNIGLHEISSAIVLKELGLIPHALKIGSVVYTICKERKLGMQILADWFVQSIRD